MVDRTVSAVAFVFALVSVYAIEVDDVNLDVDKSGWKSPTDPLSDSMRSHLDSRTCCQRLDECNARVQIFDNDYQSPSNPRIHDPTVKLVVRNILERIGVSKVKLNSKDLETLHRYLSSTEETLSQRERVRAILEDMFVQMPDYIEPTVIMRLSDFFFPYMPLLLMLIAVPTTFLFWKIVLARRSFVFCILFFAFFSSLYIAYNRRYQQVLAARMARVDGTRCQSNNLVSRAWSMITGFFLMKERDPCLIFHEDMLVSPIYEISPLDVIADVVSSFILSPLEVIGRHSNRFMNEYFRDTPLLMLPIKAFFLVFILFIVFLLFGKYNIRSMFVTLEHSATAAPSNFDVTYYQSVPICSTGSKEADDQYDNCDKNIKSGFDHVIKRSHSFGR